MTLNKTELSNYFHTAESVINTNFPSFCAKQMSKGWKITKRGYGKNAEYDVEKIEPQIVSKSQFSQRPMQIQQDLPGEKWITCFCSKNYEVSNKGRVRTANTKQLLSGTQSKNGYIQIGIDDQKYQVHRLILQSFDPIENYEAMTVDHVNGIRTDNNLNNLRWATTEANISFMIKNRTEINEEINRLIQKLGYQNLLNELKKL